MNSSQNLKLQRSVLSAILGVLVNKGCNGNGIWQKKKKKKNTFDITMMLYTCACTHTRNKKFFETLLSISCNIFMHYILFYSVSFILKKRIRSCHNSIDYDMHFVKHKIRTNSRQKQRGLSHGQIRNYFLLLYLFWLWYCSF